MSGVRRARPVRALVDRVGRHDARHVRAAHVALGGGRVAARAAAGAAPLQPGARLRAVLPGRVAGAGAGRAAAVRDGLAAAARHQAQARARVAAPPLLRAAQGLRQAEAHRALLIAARAHVTLRPRAVSSKCTVCALS